jgi:F-type H+-transporting ATPase subunit b
MKHRATQDLQTAKRAAITELHAEAATLAAQIAAKILQREISADDQQRLVDESLEELTTAQDN